MIIDQLPAGTPALTDEIPFENGTNTFKALISALMDLAPVQSINGKAGAATLTAGDITDTAYQGLSLSAILAGLRMASTFGSTTPLNLDSIANPNGYIYRIVDGGTLSGASPFGVLGGNSAILIGFSHVPSGVLTYGVQIAIGFASSFIAIRRAPYNESGSAWTAWTVLPLSVNGKTGNVSLAASDVGAAPVPLYLTATLTTTPATISNAAITETMRVVGCTFGTPSAILSDVTWTTSNGNIVLSGTMSGSTTVDLVLIETT